MRASAETRLRGALVPLLSAALIVALPVLAHAFPVNGVAQGVAGSGHAIPIATERAGARPADHPPMPEIDLPADANMIDVKRDFGARGDGTTDDTAALQAALTFATRPPEKSESQRRNATIYLPPGTYLIRDTLVLNKVALWAKRTAIQGAGAGRTVLKLADRLGEFAPGANKPMLNTLGAGSTNQAFLVFVRDLSFDIGRGNPGAVGLRFIANNAGGVRNLRIRTSDPEAAGAIGLDLSGAWVGPALLENVEITGFDTGIALDSDQYGITGDGVWLAGQRIAGFTNTANNISMTRLVSRNEGPAISNRAGLLALAGSWVMGAGSSGGLMITGPSGTSHLIDTTISGYTPIGAAAQGVTTSELQGDLLVVKGETIPVPSLAALPLDLPVDPPIEPVSAWRRVDGFTAAAMQAAFDSGAATIYLPQGAYAIDRPLTIPPSVRRIVGFYAALMPDAKAFTDPGQFVFTIDPSRTTPLLIEQLDGRSYGKHEPFRWFRDTGAPQLILRDCVLNGGIAYQGRGKGRVMLRNVVGSRFEFRAGRVATAWQLNAEGDGFKVLNEGATLTIVGLKTEGAGGILATRSGGHTTVFGGLVFVNRDMDPDIPAFDVEEARLCVTIEELSHTPRKPNLRPFFTNFMRIMSKASDAPKVLPAADFPQVGAGRVYPSVCSE